MSKIKSNLKLYIVKSGSTNKEIAEHLGKTQQQISNWVTGRYVPTLEDALKLSKLFGVTVNELFELNEEKPLE